MGAYPYSMSTKDEGLSDAVPENPEDLLPEDSVLTLEEYLAMQQSIGNRTRFEIVHRLVHGGDMSPTELVAAMDIDDSTLHYHLNYLRDVGLIEKRKRVEPTSDGFYTYYRATILAETILRYGLEELLRREWDFQRAYSRQ